MVLYKTRITKALIRLRGCAGWSAPVMFANPPKTGFLASRPISYAGLDIDIFIMHYSKDRIILVIFDDIMDMIVEISKNDHFREEGNEIYNKFRIYLFCELNDQKPKVTTPRCSLYVARFRFC